MLGYLLFPGINILKAFSVNQQITLPPVWIFRGEVKVCGQEILFRMHKASSLKNINPEKCISNGRNNILVGSSILPSFTLRVD